MSWTYRTRRHPINAMMCPVRSELIDHRRFRWKAIDWRGRPWHETVILECHVGTFTPEGTYRAMIDKLDHLVVNRNHRSRVDAARRFRGIAKLGL